MSILEYIKSTSIVDKCGIFTEHGLYSSPIKSNVVYFQIRKDTNASGVAKYSRINTTETNIWNTRAV